ncbi:hypothetical protein BGW42_007104 [Actinomortierella wolfii]|nr:hypothetical protein BGW42_007104 [Actinomortierella wolfii]
MTWFAFIFLVVCAIVLGLLGVHLVRVHRRLKLRHQKPSTHDAPTGLEGQLELSFVLAYGVDTYNTLLREHERILRRAERRERRRRERAAARLEQSDEGDDGTPTSYPPRPPTPTPTPIAPPPPAHLVALPTDGSDDFSPPPLSSTTTSTVPYIPLHTRLSRRDSRASGRSNMSATSDDLSIHSSISGNSFASSFRGPLPPYSVQPQEGDIGYGWRVVGEVPRGGLTATAASATNAAATTTMASDDQDDAMALVDSRDSQQQTHPRDTRIIFAPPALTGRTHRRPGASRLIRGGRNSSDESARNAPQYSLRASPYANVASEVREAFQGVMKTMMARIQLDAQQGSWPPLYVYQPPMDPTQVQQALVTTDNSPNVTAPGLRRPSLAPPGTGRRMSLFSSTSATTTTNSPSSPPPPSPPLPSPTVITMPLPDQTPTTEVSTLTATVDASVESSIEIPPSTTEQRA